MSLHRYAQECSGLIEELRDSLSAEDWSLLREQVIADGLISFLDWQLGEGLDEIERYLSSTPSERKRRKAWQEPKTRRMLTLGAMFLAHQGQSLLRALSDRTPIEGLSYRQGAATAGKLLLEMRHSDDDFDFLLQPSWEVLDR